MEPDAESVGPSLPEPEVPAIDSEAPALVEADGSPAEEQES
jgi:hypothetical protein